MTEKIKSIISIPEKPIFSGQIMDPKEVSSIIGTKLPDDYFELVLCYGEGIFCNCIKLITPFAEKRSSLNLFKVIEKDERLIYEDSKEYYYNSPFSNDPAVVEYTNITLKELGASGAGYPFEFFNGSTGLIPWGYWDSTYTFYWNYTGVSEYSIIVYGEEEFYYEYDMTTSEFLYSLFTNEISLEGSQIKKLDFVPVKQKQIFPAMKISETHAG